VLGLLKKYNKLQTLIHKTWMNNRKPKKQYQKRKEKEVNLDKDLIAMILKLL